MAKLDQPIWVHPVRGADLPDYRNEPKSYYETWWAFGWPYETSVFMAHLIFAGLFDRNPNIKIITHFMGGMIPYFEVRVGLGLAPYSLFQFLGIIMVQCPSYIDPESSITGGGFCFQFEDNGWLKLRGEEKAFGHSPSAVFLHQFINRTRIQGPHRAGSNTDGF